jgi:hypothetical protein
MKVSAHGRRVLYADGDWWRMALHWGKTGSVGDIELACCPAVIYHEIVAVAQVAGS